MTIAKKKPPVPVPYQLQNFDTVMVRLPNPLPKGLVVIFSEAEQRYTLAATSKKGIKTLLDLSLSGALR